MALSLRNDLQCAGYRVWMPVERGGQLHWQDTVLSATADHRREIFQQGCTRADAVWLIAPELGGILLKLTEVAESLGAQLLSPNSRFISLTQDKHQTALRLNQAGVAVPEGHPWPHEKLPSPTEGEGGSWIIKPRLGAGSMAVAEFFPQRHAAPRAAPSGDFDTPSSFEERLWGGWRLERLCPGQSVSVAAVCLGQQAILCPLCGHECEPESPFDHRAWFTPVETDVDTKTIEQLVRSALSALPPTRGYVGFDLMLHPSAPNGCGWILDVNPRLTTSYLCLRKRFCGNLAGAMMNSWQRQGVLWKWGDHFVRISREELELDAFEEDGAWSG